MNVVACVILLTQLMHTQGRKYGSGGQVISTHKLLAFIHIWMLDVCKLLHFVK
jgi:hypothetical protein